MKYKQKKAQGALEFLMTYGWAFLVILIMIGALAYFGVLNPTKFLPDRCNFGTELNCKKGEYVVKADITDTIVAKLGNQFGTSIKIYDVKVISDNEGGLGNCISSLSTKPIPTDPEKAEIWKDGETKELSINCDKAADALIAGDKVKLGVEFKWFPSSSSKKFAKTMSGELFTAVQEGKPAPEPAPEPEPAP